VTLAPLRRAAFAKRSVLSATVLRLCVGARHDSLDIALARGADPASRPQRTMRAAQLERPRHRRTLARTLRRVVGEATGPPPARPTPVILARKQILAHATDVLELAERLACPHPADARGIAIAERLVTDAVGSPLYVEEERSALNRVCRQAIMHMGDPYG
jgi:hypothetical protein